MTTFYHRLLRPLLTVAASAAILSTAAVVAGTGPAAAAPGADDCGPALVTGYGPLRSCTEVLVIEGVPIGRSGFKSTVTGLWSPQTDWVGAVSPSGRYSRNVIATDGPNGMFVGHHALNTGFGKVMYGVQHQATRGRFGVYSFVDGRFHPTQGWMPLQ